MSAQAEIARKRRIQIISDLSRRANLAFTEGSEIGNGVAISLLHDALEHSFNLIALENHAPVKPNSTFAQLVEIASEIVSAKTGEPMLFGTRLAQLNKIRVEFKHHGTTPTRSVTAEQFEAGTGFLRYLFKTLFDINIEKFTAAELLRTEVIRTPLLEAIALSREGKFLDAAGKCAVAHHYIEGALHHAFGSNSYHVPMRVGREFQPLIDGILRVINEGDKNSIVTSALLLSGLEPMDRARAISLMPHASLTGGGTWYFAHTRPTAETEEDFDLVFQYLSKLALWTEEKFPLLTYENGWKVSL